MLEPVYKTDVPGTCRSAVPYHVKSGPEPHCTATSGVFSGAANSVMSCAGMHQRAGNGQRGFSLIEVSIVTAIVLLIAVIGVPAIGAYVMENKVPKVGQELARFVMNMRINAGTSASAPYAGISKSNLAAMVADSSVLSVSSSGDILHGLGTNGVIEVDATDAGQGFLLRLTGVNHVACPSIASVMQRMASSITVESGSGVTKTVKDAGNPYNALLAESGCSKGNVNKFVFYMQ